MALLSDPNIRLRLKSDCDICALRYASFVPHSLYVTIMAKGLSVGDRVCANATKVLGARKATAEFGKQASKVQLRGKVTEKVGAGPSAKWRVRWDKPEIDMLLNARSLTRETRDLEPEDDDMNSSSDDEDESSDDAPEENPVIEDTLARPAPSDNPLIVDGIQWTAVDAITANHFDGDHHSMRILWGDDAHISSRSVYDFFLMMFPTHMLADFAFWTSTVLKDAGQAETSPQELLNVFGFLYGMTVHPYGDRRKYWSVENSEDSLLPAPAWGNRFGMGQRRFETVLRYLTFHDPSTFNESDRWHPVRTLVDTFNQRRLDKVRPSSCLVVDESFASWISRKPDDMPDALPHTQKIIRKPKGVGTEFKNLADGVTGVMLRLEIQEKKSDMADKDWSALPAGTTWLLRLCEPYFGSHRIVRADSAFTSTTAAVLLGKRGLFLQGIVKGATKEFPAKYLDNCQYQRGDHHAATATIEGVPMIALGWKDKTLKRFLSTCGTTVEGQPHTKKRYRVSEDGESSEIFYKTVKRPKLVEEYFDSASKIDVHNHLRQGSLALEEAWGTRKWHHRVFASILGMVEVDAFLLYSALHLDGKSMEHRTFTERLALSLITNTYGVPVSPHIRSLRSPQQSESASTDTAHLFMPLTTLHQYESKQGSAGGARRKCLVCVRVFKEQNNGHYFCSTCSRPPEGLIVTVCGMSSDRGSRCMDWHRERGIPEL